MRTPRCSAAVRARRVRPCAARPRSTAAQHTRRTVHSVDFSRARRARCVADAEAKYVGVRRHQLVNDRPLAHTGGTCEEEGRRPFLLRLRLCWRLRDWCRRLARCEISHCWCKSRGAGYMRACERARGCGGTRGEGAADRRRPRAIHRVHTRSRGALRVLLLGPAAWPFLRG